MIAIVDYGMGNLRSVKKGFENLRFMASLARSPKEIQGADGLVLPGVGAFGDCMRNLEKLELIEPILNSIKSGKPFLGICLGLQVLFEGSEESPEVKGLGIIRGKVIRFPNLRSSGLKVPHMGWNQVEFQKEHSLLSDVPTGSWFYFVHSYFPNPEEPDVILGKTYYGLDFTSVVSRENIFACQFHPEKSSTLGLRILRNFALSCRAERV